MTAVVTCSPPHGASRHDASAATFVPGSALDAGICTNPSAHVSPSLLPSLLWVHSVRSTMTLCLLWTSRLLWATPIRCRRGEGTAGVVCEEHIDLATRSPYHHQFSA